MKLPGQPHQPPSFPPPFPPLQKQETRLERFVNKVDANKDGHLSTKELRSAADTNNDGKVSRAEKAEMREKLQEYLSDPDVVEGLSAETLGKASEMMEFLDDPATTDGSPFPDFPDFPHKPPRPPKPPEGFPVPFLDTDGDGYTNLKYSTIFCTRSIKL